MDQRFPVLRRAWLDTLAAFGYGRPSRAVIPVALVLLALFFFRSRVTGQAVLDQADWYGSLLYATVSIAIPVLGWNLIRAPLKIANSTLLTRAEAAEREAADLRRVYGQSLTPIRARGPRSGLMLREAVCRGRV